MVQAQRVAHAGDAGSGVATVGVGEPPGLALVDADQAERPPEFGQVAGARRGYDQRPPRREEAAGLGGVARPEDAQDQGRRTVRERQGLPDVRAERRRPGVDPGGAPQRRDRQVNARAVPVRQGVQDAGEIVAGPAGQVDHQAGPARILPCGERPHGRRERRVVTAGEEPFARRDHRGGVGRTGPRPAGHEVDVALTGDVEAMSAAAGQAAAAQVQRPGADRAAKVRDDRRKRRVGRVAWVHRSVPSNRKDDQPTAARLDTRAR